MFSLKFSEVYLSNVPSPVINKFEKMTTVTLLHPLYECLYKMSLQIVNPMLIGIQSEVLKFLG